MRGRISQSTHAGSHRLVSKAENRKDESREHALAGENVEAGSSGIGISRSARRGRECCRGKEPQERRINRENLPEINPG